MSKKFTPNMLKAGMVVLLIDYDEDFNTIRNKDYAIVTNSKQDYVYLIIFIILLLIILMIIL